MLRDGLLVDKNDAENVRVLQRLTDTLVRGSHRRSAPFLSVGHMTTNHPG
jgi:hypothetical protein